MPALYALIISLGLILKNIGLPNYFERGLTR